MTGLFRRCVLCRSTGEVDGEPCPCCRGERFVAVDRDVLAKAEFACDFPKMSWEFESPNGIDHFRTVAYRRADAVIALLEGSGDRG